MDHSTPGFHECLALHRERLIAGANAGVAGRFHGCISVRNFRSVQTRPLRAIRPPAIRTTRGALYDGLPPQAVRLARYWL